MSWADCGRDRRRRRIGYAFRARCDEPGCHRRIDRGLAYACGGEHGDDETSCEGYFCGRHLFMALDHHDRIRFVCRRCRRRALRAETKRRK